MSTTSGMEVQKLSKAQGAIADTLTITRRNLTRLLRVPDSVVFGILQSVMFVLLFRYVFGGAIQVPGGSYVDFLMGGIFVQTVAFTSATTTVAMADDLQRGIIDRFRSLPMAKGAVLAGRTVSDLSFAGTHRGLESDLLCCAGRPPTFRKSTAGLRPRTMVSHAASDRNVHRVVFCLARDLRSPRSFALSQGRGSLSLAARISWISVPVRHEVSVATKTA